MSDKSLSPLIGLKKAILLIRNRRLCVDANLETFTQLRLVPLYKLLSGTTSVFQKISCSNSTVKRLTPEITIFDIKVIWGGRPISTHMVLHSRESLCSPAVPHQPTGYNVNIEIMRLLSACGKSLRPVAEVARKLNAVGKKGYDAQFKEVFEAIRQLGSDRTKDVSHRGFKKGLIKTLVWVHI